VVAALCGMFGTSALGRNLTPFPRPSATSTVVQHGIYGLIRHPLYTAVFCASIGWALVWASAPSLALAVALGPFLDAKARREERWLREQFPEYAGYLRNGQAPPCARNCGKLMSTHAGFVF
jgi:protein-S-isoprenylcysteine O-methyltransferase Ste14